MQHPGGQVTAEGHPGEAVVGLQLLDHQRSSSSCLVAGQGRVVDPVREGLGVPGVDQREVVDAGRARRGGRGLGPGLGVGVPGDLERHRQPGVAAGGAHRDPGQVERVEDQLHLLPGQVRLDLVAVAVQRYRRGLGHRPVSAPPERLGQRVGLGQGERGAAHPPGQRRGPGLGVDPVVVDLLDPGGEQPVQLAQVGDGPPRPAVGGGELDCEPVVHGPEEPLDLAPALRPARRRVRQADAEFRARPQQPRVCERRPVVHIDPLRDAPGRQRRPQRRGQAHRVLGQPPPVPDHRPGVVVDEREQVRLAAGDPGAVQRVPGPDLIRPRCLEPAEHRRRSRRGAPAQAQPGEMPLQRALVRRPPRLHLQDPPHLRRGPGRVLPLERLRQREHLRRRARRALARAGYQRVEPAGPPLRDPPVQRPPGQPHRPSVRPDVLGRRQRPHQRPARPA